MPALPPPAERVLFQWPAIEWARDNSRTVFVVEGEKDVLTLAGHGIPATTNVTGAGHWLPHYNEMLAGLNVHRGGRQRRARAQRTPATWPLPEGAAPPR